MLQLAKEKRIAQCIVDESGMTHEPETITTVLIGDHNNCSQSLNTSEGEWNVYVIV